MATIKKIIFECDICHGDAVSSYRLTWDGKKYEWDMCAQDGARIRSALEPFLSVSCRTTTSTPKPPTKAPTEHGEKSEDLTSSERDACRTFATRRGIPTSPRGRIAARTITQWRNAGSPA